MKLRDFKKSNLAPQLHSERKPDNRKVCEAIRIFWREFMRALRRRD